MFEVPGGEGAFAFDIDRPARGGVEVVSDQPVCGFRDLDSVRFSVGFHPAGDIDRVAPYVVLELAGPDHPSDCWSGAGLGEPCFNVAESSR